MVFLELSAHYLLNIKNDLVSLSQPDRKSKNSAIEYMNPVMYRELSTVILEGKILAAY